MTTAQAQPRQSWRLLWAYIRPQWRRAILLAVLLLSSIGLQLLGPQIIRYFIDQALSNAPRNTLIVVALVFLGVAVMTQVTSLSATALSSQVAWQATNDLRADLVAHCLRLDLPFHNARTPGELIERVDGDVGTLSEFFSKLIIQVFGSVLLLIGILIILFVEDWRVGLVLTLFALIALLLLYRLREVAVPSNTADRQARAKLFGLIEERIAGLDDLRANGGGWYVMRRFHEAQRNALQKGRWALTIGSSVWMTMMGLFGLGVGIAMGVGAYLFGLGLATVGTVFLIVQYTQLLRQPLEQLSEQLKQFQQAIASIDRIQSLFAMRSVIEDGKGAPLPQGALPVTFERVGFAYNDDPDTIDTEPVLTDLSFSLQPGEVIGLLGRTGSGKTTLMRLLLRLYDVTEGAIKLGTTDIRDASLDTLRQRIGVVTQDVQLFQASVRDNLTLFDSSIPDERILAIINDLGLNDWLNSLPNGLDSELTKGTGGLSAGEAQLLAFARVFLRDPGLVILDEASSRLDPATERLIERAIDRLLTGRTAIIIAHRLGTVQRADTIMILERGRLLEYGERTALLADPDSHFAQLMRTGMEDVLS